jgi:hypothetical protein
MAFPDGVQEFTFCADERPVLGRIEEREVHSEDLLSSVAVHPFGAAVPGGDAAVGVEKAKGVVLGPVRDFRGGGSASGRRELVFQEQQVTHGENVAAGAVFHIVSGSVRAQELQRAHLFPIFQELLPAFLDDGGEGRSQEIVEAPTDDVFAPETEKVTCANARLLIVPIVIGDEDRRGRVEDDCAEEGLEFAESVFGQPWRKGSLWLGWGHRGRSRFGM